MQPVKLALGKDTLVVTCTNPTRARSRTTCPSSTRASRSRSRSTRYLLEALQSLDDKNVLLKLIDTSRPACWWASTSRATSASSCRCGCNFCGRASAGLPPSVTEGASRPHPPPLPRGCAPEPRRVARAGFGRRAHARAAFGVVRVRVRLLVLVAPLRRRARLHRTRWCGRRAVCIARAGFARRARSPRPPRVRASCALHRTRCGRRAGLHRPRWFGRRARSLRPPRVRASRAFASPAAQAPRDVRGLGRRCVDFISIESRPPPWRPWSDVLGWRRGARGRGWLRILALWGALGATADAGARRGRQRGVDEVLAHDAGAAELRGAPGSVAVELGRPRCVDEAAWPASASRSVTSGASGSPMFTSGTSAPSRAARSCRGRSRRSSRHRRRRRRRACPARSTGWRARRRRGRTGHAGARAA